MNAVLEMMDQDKKMDINVPLMFHVEGTWRRVSIYVSQRECLDITQIAISSFKKLNKLYAEQCTDTFIIK